MALVPHVDDAKLETCLCLLPNIAANITSFPHDMVKEETTDMGVPLQACTVKTIVRVGVSPPNGSLARDASNRAQMDTTWRCR